jgi:hypothetical protein
MEARIIALLEPPDEGVSKPLTQRRYLVASLSPNGDIWSLELSLLFVCRTRSGAETEPPAITAEVNLRRETRRSMATRLEPPPALGS